MKKSLRIPLLILLAASLAAVYSFTKKNAQPNAILFKNATIIDGTGGNPYAVTDILVIGDTIAAIGENLAAGTAQVIDVSGKVIMPALISTHTHVGTLKGTTTSGENYTRENILAQLKKYADYGVLNILVMGTDRPMLFNGLYDSLRLGLLPGARMFSAGYGFGVPQAAPPVSMGMDKVKRPATAAQVAMEMDSVAKLHPALIKMWVDDFNGKFAKMNPVIYKAIIKEAHKHHLRIAAHLYYLTDARSLVANGIEIIAHSVRDSIIDDALVQKIKTAGIMYIPTLSLDEFAYIYARKPDWINDAFFKASLEPGVYDMITSQQYQDSIKNSPQYNKNVAAFETALKNVKKLYDAGVLISLGTDSGASPVRAQGFSEHLELELLVQAGLTPIQAITVATKNAAQLLKINEHYGTLQVGKMADFIILDDNPISDIKNTRKINAVYKAGVLVSKGPLEGQLPF